MQLTLDQHRINQVAAVVHNDIAQNLDVSCTGIDFDFHNIANLDRLYAAGVRMAGLAHFFDNDIAGSMHGVKKGGLTPLGRQVVRRMEAMGMVVDIAHASHAAVAEVIKIAHRPIVSSHGGVQATCPVNRNLSDEQIRAVAMNGGIIGVGYWEGAVCDTSPRAGAKAMKHIRDLVGIEHVALGSDYDGATTVRFDTSQLVQVTQALLLKRSAPRLPSPFFNASLTRAST